MDSRRQAASRDRRKGCDWLRYSHSAGSRLFSTHPPDSDRIDKTQKEIQQLLPAKPEYVVNTSEYTQMRERLIAAQMRRKSQDADGHPRLKVAPGNGKAEPPDETDDRPTVRRRDLIE